MSFMDSIKTCFGKYTTFAGRASRSEFWFFMLFIWLGIMVCYGLIFMMFDTDAMIQAAEGGMIGSGPAFGFPIIPGILLLVFILATFLPNLSVMVRRLHDTGRSGWWYWVALIPLIGGIILLVFFVSKGTDGDNDFGDDPLA